MIFGEEVTVQIHIADGVFVKQLHFRHAGEAAEQHSHDYDHITMVAHGSVGLWTGPERTYMGVYTAPTGIPIRAGQVHAFKSMEENTVLYCIHNVEHHP